MSLAEIVVVLAGLGAGYYLVASYFAGKSTPQNEDEAANRRRQSEGDGDAADTRTKQNPPADASQGGKQWFDVLLVAPSASADEIKQAYRRRMAEYHPDKVSQLGVDLRVLADAKTKEINIAYQEAIKACAYRRPM
jgi:DnaJ-domain-containing protein 1